MSGLSSSPAGPTGGYGQAPSSSPGSTGGYELARPGVVAPGRRERVDCSL